ncbi:metal-dependent hydrolase [Pseudonocardia sp. CA-107938]|uniref:metal-dependent hydrolase n=1 Tax=Pseudonocardia sp. CA-107938 TaxID=3240021 RepID=UPI003D8DD7B2
MTDALARNPRLRGADVGIPPRQLDFRLPAELPRWAYADNATATCFLAMLSAIFPPGEDFFVRSVVAFRDRVTDPRLQAEVRGFTGQEVIHSREHDRLNEAFTARGFDLTVAEKAIEIALGVLDQLPARQRITCTAMMEHFTALMGEELLADETFQERIHPDIAELWLWHALEELEHKSVTYDVYETIGNVRGERVLAFGLVTALVAPAALIGWAGLMIQQRVWERPGDLAAGMEMVFGRGSFLRRIVARMPLFNRVDFHPDRRDTTALEEAWRERLFGSAGTLAAQLRR